jgi:hypothetical protein
MPAIFSKFKKYVSPFNSAVKRGSYLRRIKAEYFVHLLKCRIMPEVSRYGDIPRRALILIFEWIDLHKDELIENWKRIEGRKPLKKIEPLN